MNVYVKCVECGADLEEHDVEIKWGDAYIRVTPCDCQKEGE